MDLRIHRQGYSNRLSFIRDADFLFEFLQSASFMRIVLSRLRNVFQGLQSEQDTRQYGWSVMLAYLCIRLLIGTQTRLKDGAANRIRDSLESFLDDLLFYDADLAFESFVFPVIDHLSYGKLDFFVAEKDATEFSEPRHCLSLGVDD